MITVADDSTITLDVRPVLARGEEPFAIIMEAAARVRPRGALELTAPFEPVPLYAVLSTRGFGHVAAPLAEAGGSWRVRFVQLGIAPDTRVAAVHRDYPATAPVFGKYGMDLCCGGDKALEFVAKAHGVELGKLLAELQQAALTGA